MTETLRHASRAVLQLKINREDLIQALTFHFEMTEAAWYLDAETGDILLDSDATDELPEDIEENPRYRWIESISSQASFRIMEDFVSTMGDAAAAARLSRALGGPKPFRRFKDALLDSPELREAWFLSGRRAHAPGRNVVRRERDRGLSPGKMHQTYLGAATSELTGGRCFSARPR